MFACWYPFTTSPKRVCCIGMSAARDVNQNFYAALFVQVHLQNRTFVRFGRSPSSYMRQHFKVTHSHALNDEEIPKQDLRKSKRQRVDERGRNTENYKTHDRGDDHQGHDRWVEHDQFVEADFECGVDCNEMGKFNKDDSDDIQSTEEACLDDENLCTPLMIKNAKPDVLTTWEDIDKDI